MKVALTVAGLALVITGLSGCGGSDGSEGSDAEPAAAASEEDFCANYQSFSDEAEALGDDPDPADMVTVARAFLEDMTETGTPEDMPDDAREGLQRVLDSIKGLPDDATVDDFQALGEGMSDQELKESQAFDAYVEETCGAE